MAKPEDQGAATVLVVEDEAPQLELIATILRREGFGVRAVGCAE